MQMRNQSTLKYLHHDCSGSGLSVHGVIRLKHQEKQHTAAVEDVGHRVKRSSLLFLGSGTAVV